MGQRKAVPGDVGGDDLEVVGGEFGERIASAIEGGNLEQKLVVGRLFADAGQRLAILVAFVRAVGEELATKDVAVVGRDLGDAFCIAFDAVLLLQATGFSKDRMSYSCRPGTRTRVRVRR